MSEQNFDPREFRQALGAFVTGVTVVTTLDRGGVPRGFTANSFTSVSLDPPLVLICIAKHAASYPAFSGSDGYAINILSDQQRNVATTFASRTIDRFASVDWQLGSAGHPVFSEVAAWFECRRHENIDAGDHLICIGRVVGFGHTPHTPLGYCRGTYISAGLEHEAVAAGRRHTQITAILEREGEVLLVNNDGKDGVLTLPGSVRLGTPGEADSLNGQLAAAGIDAEIGFIFSVFDEPDGKSINIAYRGTAKSALTSNDRYRFYAFDAIPWHRIADETTRVMLRRYVNERLQSRFGVYVGDRNTGRVEVLNMPGDAAT